MYISNELAKKIKTFLLEFLFLITDIFITASLEDLKRTDIVHKNLKNSSRRSFKMSG